MSNLMMSENLKDIWEGLPQDTKIKVISPLKGNLLECGKKNDRKYYSFITNNINGAFNLLNGTIVKSFIISYDDKEIQFDIEQPDIHLEYLGKRMKVILLFVMEATHFQ